MHQMHQMKPRKKKTRKKGGRRYDVARVGDHLGVTDRLLTLDLISLLLDYFMKDIIAM